MGKSTQDAIQWATAGCFVTSTTFWLVALFIYHPEPWWVVHNAFITLVTCFILDSLVACLAPGLKTRLVLMHFSLGVLQNILYIILFAMSPAFFADTWMSVYFGYYIFTWIMMITQSRQFFPMFRIFYNVHHTISFFITGTWIIVSPCCINDDNDFIFRAIVIWMSADIWVYSLNIYRSLKPHTDTDKDMIRNMQITVFCIERMHRSVAYFQPFTVPASHHNTLTWVVLGTGLFNDALDVSFQLHSICKHYQGKKLREKSKTLDGVESPALDCDGFVAADVAMTQ